MVLQSPTTKVSPILTGNCAVYGRVMGDVMLAGAAVVISDETISNDSLDTLSIDERGRTILRAPSRDELTPRQPQKRQKKPKDRDRERWRSNILMAIRPASIAGSGSKLLGGWTAAAGIGRVCSPGGIMSCPTPRCA